MAKPSTRVCRDCRQSKPLTAFPMNRTASNGYTYYERRRPECKPCNYQRRKKR